MGFPTGETFEGTPKQKEKLEKDFRRKCAFQLENKTAIWNGEFGPVYANPLYEPDAETINQHRYELLGEQLRIYDKYDIPWSIWLYKDIGLQGMVHTSPNSPWNTLIRPFLEKKKSLQLDSWGKYPSEEAEAVIDPLVKWIDSVSPTATNVYPSTWNTKKHVERQVLQTYLAESLQQEFAEQFRGKTKDELEELAKSFSFESCVQRDGLNKIMSDHAESVAK